MDMYKENLFNHCFVNNDGKSFVGIRGDTDNISIYFPIGYQLPPNEDSLREDIHHLLQILSSFRKEETLIEDLNTRSPTFVNFPIHAYLKVIRIFLGTGHYYIEMKHHFKTNANGKISWSRTIRMKRGLVQKNTSIIFENTVARSITPNFDNKITQIHRFCVYEAFKKIGWLYVQYMPEKPYFQLNTREAIYLLKKKLISTHNDTEQELFSSMLSMLKYMDNNSSGKKYLFGTYFFERIWEKMIDQAFGIKDKNQFFPRTRWLLNYGTNKEKSPLQPDSIMIYNDKIYVLDAKYYQYGYSGNPDHLPNGPDINKQITYAEYIERTKFIPSEKLYNAFIMPFNRENNLFFKNITHKDQIISNAKIIENIGEAIGEWKSNLKNYERIQGILIDTRFLMYNYADMPDIEKQRLSIAIEKANTGHNLRPSNLI